MALFVNNVLISYHLYKLIGLHPHFKNNHDRGKVSGGVTTFSLKQMKLCNPFKKNLINYNNSLTSAIAYFWTWAAHKCSGAFSCYALLYITTTNSRKGLKLLPMSPSVTIIKYNVFQEKTELIYVQVSTFYF